MGPLLCTPLDRPRWMMVASLIVVAVDMMGVMLTPIPHLGVIGAVSILVSSIGMGVGVAPRSLVVSLLLPGNTAWISIWGIAWVPRISTCPHLVMLGGVGPLLTPRILGVARMGGSPLMGNSRSWMLELFRFVSTE